MLTEFGDFLDEAEKDTLKSITRTPIDEPTSFPFAYPVSIGTKELEAKAWILQGEFKKMKNKKEQMQLMDKLTNIANKNTNRS